MSVETNTTLQYPVGIKEVCQLFSKSAADIMHLIQRYKLISPRRTRVRGSQFAYEFSFEDVQKIQRVYEYVDQGIRISMAVDSVKAEIGTVEDAEQIANALSLVLQEQTTSSIAILIETIAQLAETESESQLIKLTLQRRLLGRS